MKIVFATNNAHKLEEARRLAGDGITILSLADIECHEDLPETCDTIEGNSLQKAAYVKQHYGYDCFSDDTGLFVDALGGAPGVYSARYAGQPCDDRKNNEKLLQALKDLPQEKRGAKFVSAIALVFPEGGGSYTVRGECCGKVLFDYQGSGGFGYDPLFYHEGLGKTFAELTLKEKNRISHRANAMREFVKLLKTILKENKEETC